VIIGFDASTSYIGYCILNDDESLYDIGHLDLKKTKDLYDKAYIFRNFLSNLDERLTLDSDGTTVYIEAPLARSNNQNVVNLLQRWNGMVCTLIWEYLGLEPELIRHDTARKTLGIKVPKELKGDKMKKFLFTYVKDLGIIPEGKWAYKKTGNPKDFCFDQTDAYIIAKCGYVNESKQ
jgi:hypothetical protein